MKDFKVYQTSGMLNFLVSEASDVRKKEQTLSGDIVSFTADAQTPAKIVVDIDSTGWTGCNVWNDPVYGGSIDWNQLIASISNFDTYLGTKTIDDDGTFIFTAAQNISGNAQIYKTMNIPANHTYIAIAKFYPEKPVQIYLNYYQGGTPQKTETLVANQWNTYAEINTTTSLTTQLSFFVNVNTVLQENDVVKFKDFCLFDLTQMFGAGNEPASVEDFEALFPLDYYPYNAGTETSVSAVNGDPYQQISVTFPDEVGTVTDGTLTINYNGSVTLKTGGQTHTLTSVSPIETYIGDNNIWADAGPVSVTYPI
jgi:hypothetical protein